MATDQLLTTIQCEIRYNYMMVLFSISLIKTIC